MHYIKFPTIATYIRVARRTHPYPYQLDIIRGVFRAKRKCYLSAFKRAYGDSPQTADLSVDNTWLKFARDLGMV
jgi:hypothetical protein